MSHSPQLCSLLEVRGKKEGKENWSQLHAGVTAPQSSGSQWIFRGWRVEVKSWNVFFFIFFSLWLLFEAPIFLENSSQDIWGCLWKWGMGPLIALFMGKIRATDGEAVDGKWLNSPDFSGAQSMANTSRAMSEIPYNSEHQIAIFGALADVLGPVYPGVRMEKQPLV